VNRFKDWISLSCAFTARRFAHPPSRRYLIVSTTGLGDTLWGTPAIRALRQENPSAYIAVLTSPLGEEVLRNNPHVDECFAVASPALPSLINLFLPLRRRGVSRAYILHTSQRPILPFCSLIGCREIIGTQGLQKGPDALLTHLIESKRHHEIDRRLAIVGSPCADRSMEIFPNVTDTAAAQAILSSIPPYLPIIGLHPGAKDQFKQWPISHFIRLGKRLQDHFGAALVITGTPQERSLVDAVSCRLPGSIPLKEKLSIGALGELIRKMNLFISNDTGPMHLACAVKTPVVAPFSPTDPVLCGPIGAHALAVAKKPTCAPCLKKRCRDPFCMRQISVDEMFETAQKLFYTNATCRQPY